MEVMTRERRMCKRQGYVRVARDGKEIGTFFLTEVDSKAGTADLLPSDYALIQWKKPEWVFLFRVTRAFFFGLSDEMFLELAEKEKQKAYQWIKQRTAEIAACKDVKQIRMMDNDLTAYKGLLDFVKKMPASLRAAHREDELAVLEEEREEKREALKILREAKARERHLAKLKKKLPRIVMDAKRLPDDADGIDEFGRLHIGTFTDAGKIFEPVRQYSFRESDFDWIATRMVEIDNDSDYATDTITNVFLEFFEKNSS